MVDEIDRLKGLWRTIDNQVKSRTKVIAGVNAQYMNVVCSAADSSVLKAVYQSTVMSPRWKRLGLDNVRLVDINAHGFKYKAADAKCVFHARFVAAFDAGKDGKSHTIVHFSFSVRIVVFDGWLSIEPDEYGIIMPTREATHTVNRVVEFLSDKKVSSTIHGRIVGSAEWPEIVEGRNRIDCLVIRMNELVDWANFVYDRIDELGGVEKEEVDIL